MMSGNLLKVDMDEKSLASGSRGGDVPSSLASRSEMSDDEEGAPLLDDDFLEGDDFLDKDEFLEKEQPHTEVPAQSSSRRSFIKAEHRIALTHFLRIFSYSTRNDRLLLGAAAAASICTGVTLPLMNVVFGELVGVFSALYGPESGDNGHIFLTTINQYVMYMVYLFIARLFLGYVAILGFRMASIRISASIRLSYLQALVKQPISVLDTLPPGQTAAIITITANILQVGISEKLSMFLQSLSLVLTALAVAFYYNWLLTLVTGAGLLFIVVFYYLTIPFLVKGLKEVEEADKMGASFASEVFEMIRMVAACGAEGKMAKKYSAWVEESRRRGFLLSPVVASQQAPAFFAVHATFALSFWYAIRLYLESAISNVTVIIIILTSIMTIATSIGGIAGPLTAAAHAASAAGILYSIIDAPRPQTSGTKEYSELDSQDLVFENVNFGYPMRPDLRILENLNVKFPAGKVTAIVGASGSGKSTIVGLLERWYELDGHLAPEAMHMFSNPGMITVGGQNIKDIDLTWWRSEIGLVQQEPFLFNTTIFTNVEYGLVGTEHEFSTYAQKRKLVEQACKEAFADEFIARLPEGYNTILGDAGIKLSGGQRQRLAIARAIVKQPSILILDEATSSVDIHSERIIQLALDKISKNRTTITIAHRLSTIMKADNIVVLQKGKVVQQGTHDQLMTDLGGDYWNLANAQQLSLNDDLMSEKRVLDPEKQGYLADQVVVPTEDFEMIPYSKVAVEEQKPPALGNFMLFLWEQNYQWKWYCVMIIGALGAGISLPVHAFLFAKFISLFNLWGQLLRDQTSFWCLMLVFLAIGVAISYFILGWSSNVVSFQIVATYRKEYFHNLLTKPVSYHDHEENSTGALTSRIASDPTQLQQLLGINMAIVLISLFNILGSSALALYFGFKLALLSICTSMPIILISGYLRLHYEMKFEKLNYVVFAESGKFASEAIGAFRTVSSLTLESEICARYEGLLRRHVDEAFRKARWSTLVFAASDSSALLCMAFILWYGGQLLASHEYTPFNYMVVYLAIVQGSSAAGQSLSFGPNIASAFAAANRIRNMRPSSREDESLLIDPTLEDEKSQGVKVELRNVSFKYPTRDVPVLTNLSMTIEAGQFAAIVGPSGCGKTSIISLLESFYVPQSGSIHLSSRHISSIPLSTYRSKISLVAQEASLFSSTIRENILLGVPETDIEDMTCRSCIRKEEEVVEERMRKACKEAGIHDFIESLPEGYATCVGSRGVALSGGQKQRLSMARALIRSPSLLLLDEATSALDSETEKEVMRVFDNDGSRENSITRIVVAHRLATVQRADVIFVMGEGRVVEKGTHAELVRTRGVYWEMCQGQSFGG